MVEIKGFNEAYKAMLAKETVKKIHKKHTDNRVQEVAYEKNTNDTGG